MDLRNSKGLSQGTFTLQLLLYNFFFCMEAFGNFHQKWKTASCGAQFRYSQIK